MTDKRFIPTPPPLTVGIIPDSGEEVAFPTPEPERRGGNSGLSRKTVREMIRRAGKCCPPIVSGWAQQLTPVAPLTIPTVGSGLRLVLQPQEATPDPFIVSFVLAVAKMEDPNATQAKVEIEASPFNFGTTGAMIPVAGVTYTVDPSPIWNLLQVDLNTDGAEISIYDLVLTNVCGCCTSVPVEVINPGP